MKKTLDWMENLAVGDEVALKVSGLYGGSYLPRKVERVTKTRIIVCGLAFYKLDGRQYGETATRSRTTTRQCVPLTQEILDIIIKDDVSRKIVHVGELLYRQLRDMSSDTFNKFPAKELEGIYNELVELRARIHLGSTL